MSLKKLFPLSLNAARAPQLKASVGRPVGWFEDELHHQWDIHSFSGLKYVHPSHENECPCEAQGFSLVAGVLGLVHVHSDSVRGGRYQSDGLHGSRHCLDSFCFPQIHQVLRMVWEDGSYESSIHR